MSVSIVTAPTAVAEREIATGGSTLAANWLSGHCTGEPIRILSAFGHLGPSRRTATDTPSAPTSIDAGIYRYAAQAVRRGTEKTRTLLCEIHEAVMRGRAHGEAQY